MRSEYYNFFTQRKWGDASNYHMTVDTGRFTLDGAAALLADAVHRLEACNSPSPRPAGAELPCCTSFPTCFFFVSLPIFQPLFTYLISPSTLYPIDPARSGRPHLWFGTERGKTANVPKRPPSTTRYGVGTAAFRRCRGDCAIYGWRWER